MKKILSFMILLAGVISITSCSDDDFTYTAADPLDIQAAEVIFEAAGGEGYIQVGEAGTISAETSSSWLQLAVNGQQISVVANVNLSLEGRSAVIKVKAGNKEATVTATQTGVVMNLSAPESLLYNDNAHTTTYDYKCSIPTTLTTSAAWLKAELVDDQLKITTEANNSGSIRTGYVYCQAGAMEKSIEITQGEIDKDVIGKTYILGGIDPEPEDPDDPGVGFLATITKENSQYTLTLPALGLSMPVTFNNANLTMTISGGNYMGQYEPYFVYSVIGDNAEGYVIWDTAVTMTASLKQVFERDEENTYSYVVGDFKDDGKWSGYTCDSFALGAFKAQAATNANWLGTLIFFTDVYIMDRNMVVSPNAAPAKVKKALDKGLALSKKYAPVAE